jgi:hypothetical protein
MKRPVLCLATVTLFSCVLVLDGNGGEKQALTVRALSYRAIPHERTTYYQTQGQSSTTCYGSGTDWGYSTSINIDCQTVSTPPKNIPITVRSLEVYNLVETNGMVYTITCTASGLEVNAPGLFRVILFRLR